MAADIDRSRAATAFCSLPDSELRYASVHPSRFEARLLKAALSNSGGQAMRQAGSLLVDPEWTLMLEVQHQRHTIGVWDGKGKASSSKF